MGDAERPTASPEYADRLVRRSTARWKSLLHAQAPYQWHVRRMRLGRAVDVGCGIGRNLGSLDPGSVGVDHNARSIEVARARGLDAYTDTEFFADPVLSRPGSYDGLLVAHVVEHLDAGEAVDILRRYVTVLRPGGSAVFVTPQERGYRSDATHVRFSDHAVLRRLAADLGLVAGRQYSFPLPRVAGKVFTYNEFVLVTRRPGTAPESASRGS